MGLMKGLFQRGYVIGPREVIKCERNVDLPDLFGVARLDCDLDAGRPHARALIPDVCQALGLEAAKHGVGDGVVEAARFAETRGVKRLPKIGHQSARRA